MAIILNIDTATETGSVCLASEGRVLASRSSTEQRDHAAVLSPYITEVLQAAGVAAGRLDAVAITGGPGSYTGLRVAASTAKGLCYALGVPLIAVGTLEVMAAARRAAGDSLPGTLYCPVIEARRLDLFAALYDGKLQPLLPPGVYGVDESFLAEFRGRPVEVFGTGMDKCRRLQPAVPGRRYVPFSCQAAQLAPLAEQAFREGRFEDIAYFEPWYLKAFYHPGGSR